MRNNVILQAAKNGEKSSRLQGTRLQQQCHSSQSGLAYGHTSSTTQSICAHALPLSPPLTRSLDHSITLSLTAWHTLLQACKWQFLAIKGVFNLHCSQHIDATY
jgi:hypothetical protein